MGTSAGQQSTTNLKNIQSASILPILKKGGFMQVKENGNKEENSRSYKDYHTMFANANTKSLLKELKTTLKEPATYMKKPTLGRIENKVASIRKA